MLSVAKRGSFWTVPTAGLLAVLLVLTACGGKKAPVEANALLGKALQALVDKDFNAFGNCLLPAQRATLGTLKERPFFEAVVGHAIDNEFDTNVTATTASVFADLYFTPDKKQFSTINWALRQEGGRWFLDLDDTIRGEKARNGANAFQSWIIKIQKR